MKEQSMYDKRNNLFNRYAVVLVLYLLIGCIRAFVHELGHYVSATAFGLYVKEFTITLFDGGSVRIGLEDLAEIPVASGIMGAMGGITESLLLCVLGIFFYRTQWMMMLPIPLSHAITEGIVIYLDAIKQIVMLNTTSIADVQYLGLIVSIVWFLFAHHRIR